MNFSLKSVKKFLWDYKYIIALLLVLLLIYRQLGLYIVENLENKLVSGRTYQPTIKNTSDFDIDVEVYEVTYDEKTKVNKMDKVVIKKQTIKPSQELKVSKSINLDLVDDKKKPIPPPPAIGVAVKFSTTDNSAKNISAEFSICSDKSTGPKKICNIFKPNIAQLSELKDHNFKVLHDANDVSITSPNTDAKWLIKAVKPYSMFSIGFKF